MELCMGPVGGWQVASWLHGIVIRKWAFRIITSMN